MKCLSLIQPWASLIIRGAKRYETRSWSTNYRGPLLISSSKKFPDVARQICLQDPFATALDIWDEKSLDTLPLGCILGRINLTAVVPAAEVHAKLDDDERAFGDFTPGRFAWLMEDALAFDPPIPWRGSLGLFDVPDHILPEAACAPE